MGVEGCSVWDGVLKKNFGWVTDSFWVRRLQEYFVEIFG